LGNAIEIRVPDIGDFDEVEVVEILVAKGDRVAIDDPLVSIESEKATMEIPSPAAGVIAELRVAEGDRVSEGSVLVLLEVEGALEEASTDELERPALRASESLPEQDSSPRASAEAAEASELDRTGDEERSAAKTEAARPMSIASANPVPDRVGLPHASPLVRRFARELGVPVEDAEGTGPSGRVLVDDLKREVRERFAGDKASGEGVASGIPRIPPVDFSAFGPIREEPLSRIQKVSGPSLHRSWLNVPHVTQHDEADITELERFRAARREAATERGVKLSPLLFVMKAVVIALREFPVLRSSLAPAGDRLIVKDYFHFGVAVDTDQGLVVPVIRDVDKKGVFELAAELSDTAERARNRKLRPDDLQGAVFTLSSLGGIGGTAFSPIVNAPEVAILGLSRTRVQPVWQGPFPLDADAASAVAGATGGFEPRLVLPLSLSYDHRVIDGAEAVRFTTRLARLLADPMLLLL
jgi:pyruvate dehydrogenase E2 component (dihydrolipoamide acetyltransferase)